MSTVQNLPLGTSAEGADTADTAGGTSSVSLPVFQVVEGPGGPEAPGQHRGPPPVAKPRRAAPTKHQRNAALHSMEGPSTTVAQVHTTPVRVHQSGRKSKSQSRHDRHRCHKSRNRSREPDRPDTSRDKLVKEISKLKNENYLLNRKLNLSLTSLDSGLAQSETLPPFDMDVNNAYQHLKSENTKLMTDLNVLKSEYRDLSSYVEKVYKENQILNDDVLLLKNLVYKLNVELERYQMLEADVRGPNDRKWELLPDNYNKNFLKPVLPLLKAYSQTIQEKNELVDDLERDFKRFHTSFHEVMKENERLYIELEKKAVKCEGSSLDELRRAKKDLDTARQEMDLLNRQILLGKEKLQDVHAVYRVKVTEMAKDKEVVAESLQECRMELYTTRGKYSVLKQEFERVKMDGENRIPLAVHSASITECKRLFFDLKNEYEAEKRNLLMKLKQLEGRLADRAPGKDDWELRSENEELKKKMQELESRDGSEKNLSETRNQLRESRARVHELSGKLAVTRKQLHKAMAFAEDIVREQEGLLLQLHAKQKENQLITTQFGSLKKQIKSVEKGANEGLNSIEQTIKDQEAENSRLAVEVKRLKVALREKEELLDRLQPTRDSTS